MFPLVIQNFTNDIIVKIFRNNSRNFLKYFSKMSAVFLDIFQNLSWNFLKWFSKSSDIIFIIFRNIFRNFRTIYGNYSPKFSEILLESVRSIFRNLWNFSRKFWNNFWMQLKPLIEYGLHACYIKSTNIFLNKWLTSSPCTFTIVNSMSLLVQPFLSTSRSRLESPREAY